MQGTRYNLAIHVPTFSLSLIAVNSCNIRHRCTCAQVNLDLGLADITSIITLNSAARRRNTQHLLRQRTTKVCNIHLYTIIFSNLADQNSDTHAYYTRIL